MSNRCQHYLSKAISSLIKANKELKSQLDRHENQLDRHEKILKSHAQEIVTLQQQTIEYRNNAILSDLDAGLSGKEVAEKYNLSPGRISQIKNQ